MKKSNILSLLLAVLVLTSCSKDETTMSITQATSAIEFGTYVGRDAQTRAGVIDATILQTKGFGVFAYYTNEGDYTSGTSTPNFMYNTKVSGAEWTYTPIKYWPNETRDKLTLFAYAPYSENTNSNITDLSANNAAGDPTLKFTVSGTVKNQSDLLYADASSLKNIVKQTTGSKVNFPFKHALSRIGFKVEAMVDKVNDNATGTADDGAVVSDGIAPATTISVQKVELIGGFTTSATYNFATNSWSSPTTDAGTNPIYPLAYNATNATSNFVNAVAENVTTTAQLLNMADSYIMIIPKTFDATTDPLRIKITYTVTTTDANLDGDKSEVTNIITSDPFSFAFEAGKAYSFNLKLGLTSVRFDASAAAWDETAAETTANAPTNISDIDPTTLPESNSYIVAPGAAALHIPVSRANASDLLDPQEQLGAEDAFTAELVWTDNENGIAPNSNIKSIGTAGVGPTGFLVVEPGSASGNAVVAIKKDDKILWSWHIWVTEDTPAVLGSKGFMDRNLGAIGNTPGQVGTKGLLYQWGRKDPFPGSTAISGGAEFSLYDAAGLSSVIAQANVTTYKNFANSVANPAVFYNNNGNPYDWYTNNSYYRNDNLWGGTSTKTIYDPCPEGWRMPKKEDWNGLNTSNFTWDDNTKGGTSDTYGGFYPAAGVRYYFNSLEGIGSNGHYWSATVYDLARERAYSLYFYNLNISPSSTSNRYRAQSVRCIKNLIATN